MDITTLLILIDIFVCEVILRLFYTTHACTYKIYIYIYIYMHVFINVYQYKEYINHHKGFLSKIPHGHEMVRKLISNARKKQNKFSFLLLFQKYGLLPDKFQIHKHLPLWILFFVFTIFRIYIPGIIWYREGQMAERNFKDNLILFCNFFQGICQNFINKEEMIKTIFCLKKKKRLNTKLN